MIVWICRHGNQLPVLAIIQVRNNNTLNQKQWLAGCRRGGRGRKRSIFSNSGIFLHSLMDAYFFLSCYYHRDLSTSTDPMHKAVTANILLERYQKPSIPACCPLQACSPFPGGSFWGCAQSLKSCPTLWAPIQYSCLENPMDGGAW